MTAGSDTLEFSYGQNGVASVLYGDNEYFYIRNAQGDIIGLIDDTGEYVVRYTYDSWGNPTSKTGPLAKTIGTLNPFRYRGYIYEEDTELYYLQSRYYNPVWGRFINADKYCTTGAYIIEGNMYAYCVNDPAVYSDPSGMMNVREAALGWGSSCYYAPSYGGGSGAKSIVEPLVVAAGTAAVAITALTTTSAIDDLRKDVINMHYALTQAVDDGFKTFRALKRALGSPGEGYEWHHIVEQCQIEKSGFSPIIIHSPMNLVPMKASTHRAISGYYGSAQPYTNGMKVRDWLIGQTFEEQYAFGLSIMTMYLGE
ncbi:MAG: hypothetical protein IJU16_03120 [Clostridia bacterium]|nr:hypothetical protein [Clostridia bacterium]